MINSDKFQELYSKLNPEQQEAVNSIDGPVMVIAGPGTGKTQILTLRIANILKKTDLPPEAVLALTFTEAGTATMRRRLADIIGEPAYSVNLSTFHGFANDAIGRHPEYFPSLAGFKPISETNRARLVESLIKELPLNLIRPFGDPLHNLRAVLRNLDTVKREGWTADKFQELITKKLTESETRPDRIHQKSAHVGKVRGEVAEEETNLKRLLEFGLVYKEYQQKLRARREYDFADMILELLKELENGGELLQILQEKYQYVLVDEHQDTNWAQNRVLELLLDFHPSPNLFIVGDEKQAIFRFQGASLNNFRYFQTKFSGTKLITLKNNYRSTQTILDGAHGLAGTINPESVKLSGNKGIGNKINFSEFTNPEIETAWLADQIVQKIKDGAKAEEIAVLYRENRDGKNISSALRLRGLPHQVESEENVLEDRRVNRFLRQLDLATDFGSPEKIVLAVHSAFKDFSSLDIYKLLHTKNFAESLRDFPIFTDWANQISGWESFAKQHGLPEALTLAFRESGFLGELLSHSDPEGELEKARALLNAAKELTIIDPTATIRTFLEHLRTLRENGFELETKPRSNVVPGKVRLMTVHRAKGQEFETVYLFNVGDNRWGGRKKPNSLKLPADIWRAEESGDPLEDERKLFYVALTRAKQDIFVTFSSTDKEGREVLPTRFLKEISTEHIENLDVKDYELNYQYNPDLTKTPIKEEVEGEKEFILRLFEDRAFSVTHLNNYLKCPWQYFYNNLLRIPEIETRHQAYGIAVHGALRRLFELRRKKEDSKEKLIKLFEEELEKTKISPADKEDALKKGRESLAGWYETNSAFWPEESLVELPISGVVRNGIQLTGKIDKLEYLKNGGMRVIDFKTSKAQTRNKLFGLTKDADGNYLRQLAFYKFLLNNYDGGKYKMEEGVIDFLEPDDKKRYKLESFSLEEIPLEKTLLELDNTIKEIREFSFRDKFCDDPDCRYCNLRRQVAP